jgi:CRP-like cAMP-binding protein
VKAGTDIPAFSFCLPSRSLHGIAHLLCEIWFRLKWVGLSDDHTFDLPLIQGDLGDATGLSIVHVNRTIKQLRKDGLIRMSKGRIAQLLDWQRLTEVAEFDPTYLQVPAR